VAAKLRSRNFWPTAWRSMTLKILHISVVVCQVCACNLIVRRVDFMLICAFFGVEIISYSEWVTNRELSTATPEIM
jgi:hypothetical protein